MAEVRLFLRNMSPHPAGLPPWGIGPVCISQQAQAKWFGDTIPEVSTTSQAQMFFHNNQIKPTTATEQLPGKMALLEQFAAKRRERMLCFLVLRNLITLIIIESP